MLKTRLGRISDSVRSEAVLCDIGTDHADLVVSLMLNKKIKFAYATDLREGPLKRAKENIKNAGIEDKVECILSDGFENLKNKNDITDVVISGLGGETIIQILTSCPILHNPKINFILSPQSKEEKLRVFLNENGHKFNEITVDENGKKYLIFISKFSDNKTSLSLKQEFFGLNDDEQYKKIIYNTLIKRLKNKEYELERRSNIIKLLDEVKNDYS